MKKLRFHMWWREYVALFTLLAITFISIATPRHTYPEDGCWWVEIDSVATQSRFVATYIRVNNHGWPMTTVERYRCRWNGGVDASGKLFPVTDELKGMLRTKVRNDAFRYRKSTDWAEYLHITSAFPNESGIKLNRKGFVVNLTAAALAATAAVIVISRLRIAADRIQLNRRQRRGLCTLCKYDMRGSIESGRCPECGTPWNTNVAPELAAIPRSASTAVHQGAE